MTEDSSSEAELLRAERDKYREQAAEWESVHDQVAALMTRVADIVYGPPEDGRLNDWSRVPDMVAALKRESDQMHRQL